MHLMAESNYFYLRSASMQHGYSNSLFLVLVGCTLRFMIDNEFQIHCSYVVRWLK